VLKGQLACIEVTPEDATTLRMWAGSQRGERRLAARAQVILLSSAGASLAEISGRKGLKPQGCSHWRQATMRPSCASSRLSTRANPQRELHVILDNLSVHKHHEGRLDGAPPPHPALHAHLRLLAQPGGDLVQHLRPRRAQGRGVALRGRAREPHHEVHPQLLERAGQALRLDLHRQTAGSMNRVSYGTRH
jgi:hypothetical protein